MVTKKKKPVKAVSPQQKPSPGMLKGLAEKMTDLATIAGQIQILYDLANSGVHSDLVQQVIQAVAHIIQTGVMRAETAVPPTAALDPTAETSLNAMKDLLEALWRASVAIKTVRTNLDRISADCSVIPPTAAKKYLKNIKLGIEIALAESSNSYIAQAMESAFFNAYLQATLPEAAKSKKRAWKI